MSDLDQLRSLGERLQPPAMAVLEDTARRRDRRRALTSIAGGLAAILLVAGGAVAMSSQDGDRTLPDPIDTPTPSPQITPTPTPDASPTHQSDTSMTPKEVVLAENAELGYTGVSADDPDFRLSVWTAECLWCPRLPDSQLGPVFKAVAVTTDGWRTATYRRPPRGVEGIFYVHSPAPEVLLVVDAANGGEWQVREDGTWSLLPHVVEERMAESPRQWFSCRLSGTYRITWCAYDVRTEAVYEWGGAWAGGPDDDTSAVSPVVGVEPWGRARLRSDVDGPLTAWWYEDGVRRTRTLIERIPFNSRAGSVLGADEDDLLYWSVARGEDLMRFFVGDDLGQSWREIEQQYPAELAAEANVDVLSTPDGTLILRHVAEAATGSRTRLWRLDSLEGGDWQLVHDTGELPLGVDTGTSQLTVVGPRLWSGTLSSADDGRSWTQPTTWR